MTDFVVSKVAMSVCALLVAGCLSEIVSTSTGPDPGGDLAGILADLQGDVSSLAELRGECSLEWPVPSLPSGGPVELSVGGGAACARSGTESRSAEVHPPPHTWGWDGLPLNSTELAERDLASPVLTARSGDTLSLRMVTVTLDGSEEPVLFASVSSVSP
ncbi:MAG: hypothetical protein AB1793_06770 [Candidatus Thermoplasmatota archaeon]